jgi:hypothetical protein
VNNQLAAHKLQGEKPRRRLSFRSKQGVGAMRDKEYLLEKEREKGRCHDCYLKVDKTKEGNEIVVFYYQVKKSLRPPSPSTPHARTHPCLLIHTKIFLFTPS